jgi:hypothetical protein
MDEPREKVERYVADEIRKGWMFFRRWRRTEKRYSQRSQGRKLQAQRSRMNPENTDKKYETFQASRFTFYVLRLYAGDLQPWMNTDTHG